MVSLGATIFVEMRFLAGHRAWVSPILFAILTFWLLAQKGNISGPVVLASHRRPFGLCGNATYINAPTLGTILKYTPITQHLQIAPILPTSHTGLARSSRGGDGKNILLCLDCLLVTLTLYVSNFFLAAPAALYLRLSGTHWWFIIQSDRRGNARTYDNLQLACVLPLTSLYKKDHWDFSSRYFEEISGNYISTDRSDRTERIDSMNIEQTGQTGRTWLTQTWLPRALV